VATGASAHDLTVINLRWQHNPVVSIVAIRADIATVDMRGAFTCGNRTIMTGNTCTQHLGMVDGTGQYRCPPGRKFLVAGIANIGRCDMRGALTAGRGAVMAGNAVAGKAAVVRGGTTTCQQPVVGAMTGIAFIGSDNMRSALARGNHAIVATRAGAIHLRMIHGIGQHRCPRRRTAVTGVADISGIDVRGTFASGMRAIVAGIARLTSRRIMIKHGHQPVLNHVTTITGQHSRNVIVTFALSNHAVMAALTGANDLGMINGAGGHRCPGRRNVTGRAIITRYNMTATFTSGNAAFMATDTGALHLGMINGTG
jgi:hypothetical protein